MFCENCGKELAGNNIFCPNCGAKIENSDSNPVCEPELEDDFTVTPWHISGRTIIKMIGLIMIVCFFCPMFMVSCAGIDVLQFSLLDIAKGAENTDGESLWGIWLFLLYFMGMFGITMEKESRKNHGKEAAANGGCVGLALIIVKIYADSYIESQGYYADVRGLLPYYLCIIGAIISVLIGIRIDYLQRKIDNQESHGTLTEKEIKRQSIISVAKEIGKATLGFFIMFFILAWMQS